MTDFAQLGLQIDSSTADDASEALDRLSSSAENTEEKVLGLGKRLERQGLTMEEMKRRSDQFTAGLGQQGEATTKSQRETERFMATLQRQVETYGMSRTQLLAYRAAQLEFTDEQAAVAAAHLQALDAVERSGNGLEELGLKSRRARDQIGLLTRDILRGDFSQVGNRLGQFISQSELSISTLLRVIGPIAGVVGGIVAIGQAFNQGEKESIAFNNALQVSGNFAGMTRQSMIDLAHTVEETSNLTIAQSKNIVRELVQSGQISSSSINQIAGVAENLARATGRDVDKIGADLVKIFADPAKGAEELNKQMNFLNASELSRLKTLVELGREGEAQLFLAERLAEKLSGVGDNLGTLERAWVTMRRAASSAWDAMLNIGRERTLEQQLEAAQNTLARLQSTVGLSPEFGGTDPAAAAQAAIEVDRLQRLVDAQREAAEAAADRVTQEREAIRLAEENKRIREQEIQDVVRIAEAENRARNAAIQGRHQLGQITAEQRDAQLLASDLELASARLLANEKQRNAENLSRIDRARLETEARLTDIQRRSRIEDFERAQDLARIQREAAQADADARARQATTAGQLGDIADLQRGNEALRQRQRELGLTREQVDALRQSMLSLKEAELEREIGESTMQGTAEDDPYIQRLREMIRLIQERKNLELGTDVVAQREASFQREQEALTTAREQGLLLQREYDDEELEMRVRHEAAMYGITNRAAIDRLRLQRMSGQQQFNTAVGFLESMTASAAHHSKAMFEIHKIASLANSVVKGIEAVQGAFAFGNSIGGPPMGFAMAAIATAAQAVNVAAIASSQFGGGAQPNFGGAAVAAPQTSPITGIAPTEPTRRPSTTIIQFNGTASEQQLLERFVDMLNESSVDGSTVIVKQKVGA